MVRKIRTSCGRGNGVIRLGAVTEENDERHQKRTAIKKNAEVRVRKREGTRLRRGFLFLFIGEILAALRILRGEVLEDPFVQALCSQVLLLLGAYTNFLVVVG